MSGLCQRTLAGSGVIGGFDSVRFPRSMLNSPANERLLRLLGVRIVDDCDAELEDYARAWLATQPPRDRSSGRSDDLAISAVKDALERLDAKRRAA
jgi:hypothetical protein